VERRDNLEKMSTAAQRRINMRIRLFIGILFLTSFAVWAAARSAADEVPSKYANLYSRYEEGLNRFNAYLDKKAGPNAPAVIFGAELLPANSNIGPGLLEPRTIEIASLTLDRFKEMGLKGVTVAIGYPILTDDVPRAPEYIAFYKKLAGLVRERGLKLCVKLHVVFAGTVFARVPANFSGLTVEKLMKGKRLMAERVIGDLAPDYLTLGGEPDTEASLTGLKELNNPETYAKMTSVILDSLPKGKTLVGVGQGTWVPAAFAEAYAKTGIDFINIHFYPFGPRIISNTEQVCAIAQRSHKRLILDECWLYKASGTGEGGVAASESVYRRDVFSFWQPLDQRFLEAMAKLAAAYRIEYVSPFWSNLFFASLPYDPADENLSYRELQQKFNRAASGNIRAGILTETGKFYVRLIKRYGG
jgi:hypothetical protein